MYTALVRRTARICRTVIQQRTHNLGLQGCCHSLQFTGRGRSPRGVLRESVVPLRLKPHRSDFVQSPYKAREGMNMIRLTEAGSEPSFINASSILLTLHYLCA